MEQDDWQYPEASVGPSLPVAEITRVVEHRLRESWCEFTIWANIDLTGRLEPKAGIGAKAPLCHGCMLAAIISVRVNHTRGEKPKTADFDLADWEMQLCHTVVGKHCIRPSDLCHTGRFLSLPQCDISP